MSKSPEKVSIIIPHWNGIDILSECLDSLSNLDYTPLEIIVVDNASTDGSQDWIKQNHPDIILIENEENHGYAGGCNIGAGKATGNYFVFLNNDTIQEKNWITELVNYIQKNPTVGAVQPKIMNYFQRDLFDYAGGSGGEMDILCYPFARGRIFDTQEQDRGQYDEAKRVFWSSGTAFLIMKELFETAGRFDETFFAHMEEIDLCWRVQKLGFEIHVVPDAIVYHKNAVTLPKQSVMKYYLNHRNSLIMLLANYSPLVAVYLFPIRIMLDLVAMLYALIRKDLNHVIGIMKALGWILFHPQVIIKKRRDNSLRGLNIKNLKPGVFFRGSIVVAYYLLGRKTYGEIASNPSR